MEEKTITASKKAKRNVFYLTISAVALVLVVNVGLGTFLLQKNQSVPRDEKVTVVSEKTNAVDTFSYKGNEGKDALSLLKEKTKTEQNNSGLVVSINSRRADDAKKEFWAFYVNGKMAEVGPSEYITKDGDLIEWKIERY
ncbi:MAG: DUF4430 domain-containing protein [Candidatus Levybacteria bacterium]|nr:DUF4430 domain-containing protein [Candidatus Levybacteria bacterium]